MMQVPRKQVRHHLHHHRRRRPTSRAVRRRSHRRAQAPVPPHRTRAAPHAHNRQRRLCGDDDDDDNASAPRTRPCARGDEKGPKGPSPSTPRRGRDALRLNPPTLPRVRRARRSTAERAGARAGAARCGAGVPCSLSAANGPTRRAAAGAAAVAGTAGGGDGTHWREERRILTRSRASFSV